MVDSLYFLHTRSILSLLSSCTAGKQYSPFLQSDKTDVSVVGVGNLVVLDDAEVGGLVSFGAVEVGG